MNDPVVGLVSPGGMGSAVAACLRAVGHTVLWASEGRSDSSQTRANDAGLTDVQTMDSLVKNSDIVLSIVPPHAAVEVAESARGARVYVDANAVAPDTAQEVADVVTANGAAYVDGAIIGSPPVKPGTARLYLCGERAESVAQLFAGTNLDAIAMPGDQSTPRASTLKMCYAAWTKGSEALILSVLATARRLGADADLLAEWQVSQPVVLNRTVRAGWSAATKGWRWVGEMQEIAATFESAGLPGGFHQAAAEVFSRVPRAPSAPQDDATLDQVITTLSSSE